MNKKKDIKRAATVLSKGVTHMAILGKEDFQNIALI